MASQLDPHSWLPTEFLPQQDSLFMDKDSSFSTTEFNSTESKLSSCFPTEFPYEFDSLGSASSLGSPEESVLGSLETTTTDCDEFFAGLTRRLSQKLAFKPEKKWVIGGSPESTLTGLGSWSASSNGSPNGVLSPPTTPFGAKNETWDLIHEAAGEVARLKLNIEMNKFSNFQDMSFISPTMTQNSVGQLRSHSSEFYSARCFPQDISTHRQQFQRQMRQEQVPKRQCSSVWGRHQVKMGIPAQSQPINHLPNPQQHIPAKARCVSSEHGRCVRPVGSSCRCPQMPQPTQHQQHLQSSSSGMRAVVLGGSGVKKERAGTGVFLPRRYGNINSPSEPKKKTACPTVLLPAKVVHALNLNFNHMKQNIHSQRSFNSDFPSDYDVLMARRNAFFTQQKRNLRPQNREIHLPQEWTY